MALSCFVTVFVGKGAAVGGAMKGQHHPSGGGLADSLDFLQMQQLQQQVPFLYCTTVLY
jgi:hypothetical protein